MIGAGGLYIYDNEQKFDRAKIYVNNSWQKCIIYIYDNNAWERTAAPTLGTTNFLTSTNDAFIVLNNEEFLVKTS